MVTEHLPRWRSGTCRLPYFAKFDTLEQLVTREPGVCILQMDADAMFVREFTASDVLQALARHPFAMMEQTTIVNSDNDRPFFFDHYMNHPMVWFEPGNTEQKIESFHYYNSGVLLCTALAMREFLDWALPVIDSMPVHHRVGEHIIADQDYLQYWLNTVHPGMCGLLPWYWNHCEHWHDDFPRSDAWICHFSSFCRRPESDTAARMQNLLDQGTGPP